MIGHNARLPRLDALEQVRFRHERDPLPPGAIARGEMAHVEVFRQARLHPIEQLLAHHFRLLEGAPGELCLIVVVLATHNLVDPRIVHAQHAQLVGENVFIPCRDEVGGRALQQRDMLTFAGNGGHHGRRCRA